MKKASGDLMPDVIGNSSTWLHTLPPWTQPAVATFIPCVVVLAALMIRHRINLHRRGEQFTTRKKHPAELVAVLLCGGALFYFHAHVPSIATILDWPDRTFPYYRAHGFMMWVGFFTAGYVAMGLAKLFAALFLRGGGSRRGGRVGVVSVGTHDMLPDPPPGFGWYSKPVTRQRITRTRTYSEDE
jgi:hypothetical protein